MPAGLLWGILDEFGGSLGLAHALWSRISTGWCQMGKAREESGGPVGVFEPAVTRQRRIASR